ELSFAPRLPQRLTRLVFRLCFKGRRLKVEVNQREAQYSLVEGEPLDIAHHGAPITVSQNKPVTERIPPGPARKAPRQPLGREPARRQIP
nr:family 65 glycosyl hydrolase [Actinomycetota bacterium]